jgi:hypothetical protein
MPYSLSSYYSRSKSLTEGVSLVGNVCDRVDCPAVNWPRPSSQFRRPDNFSFLLMKKQASPSQIEKKLMPLYERPTSLWFGRD